MWVVGHFPGGRKALLIYKIYSKNVFFISSLINISKILAQLVKFEYTKFFVKPIQLEGPKNLYLRVMSRSRIKW